ncbi:DNA methyltransferase [Sporosarcina limicola]|uniref:DNA modification methylase n=1 Tax=Sporosarcina limicola TaxID=34101 RepID=A0A927MKE5_9BACL|nr:DNA methyltransferase [Sporosarcina limicola]MBE1555501.1 DNA modification methylase [Sporosarcina limicola]
MTHDPEQLSLLNEQPVADNTPVVCLGMTFENEEARRQHFREELRKKLPELKQIEGFPIGDEEDIIALSDPPYYTACPNPWISDFVEKWENEKITIYNRDLNEEYHREPFAADVSEGRSDPIYMAHNYHTKVPPKAIVRYLLHYTNPGDIVLDGFGGTGMTGVASSLCGNKQILEEMGYLVKTNGDIFEDYIDDVGNRFTKKISKIGERKAILNDLSPVATHISNNYNNPIEFNENLLTAKQIIQSLRIELSWIYTTIDEDTDFNYENVTNLEELKLNLDTLDKNKIHEVNYFIKSDLMACPHCLNEMKLWDVTIDKGVTDGFECPNCHAELKKKNTEKIFIDEIDTFLNKTISVINKPIVRINYKVNGKQQLKKASKFDLLIEHLAKDELEKSNLFVPIVRMPEGDEARRNDKSGITHTHHFYTKRNMYLLSILWEKAKDNKVLKLTLTSILLKTASLLHNIGLKNGSINLAGALPNSLYIPGNVAERNIFILLENKLKDIEKAELYKRESPNVVSCSAMGANYFSKTLSESIDYIFIDPPFGSNLMYSELNFLWESWLKVFTNNNLEAIVNKTQKKSIEDYKVLMSAGFTECFRVLKPNRWMTVEFSNTKASIWNAIQQAIQESGFMIISVAALHKGQGTYNAQTNPTSVTQDLVITAYKPLETISSQFFVQNQTNQSYWSFVKQYLELLPSFVGNKSEVGLIVERTPRILYDRLVSYYVQNGFPVPISSAEFQIEIMRKFPMRDGMAFLESQVAEYDKKRTLVKEFSQMSLFVSDENSAIEWIRQQLMRKPQTRQDLHPQFMKEIQHIAKHEQLPELDDLLAQNFLRFEGDEAVPDQIGSYLRRNYHEFRGLENTDEKLKEKAMNRWYVPDPNKQADLEKLREKTLLREFENYVEELGTHKKKLRQFRTEAVRAGFKKAWSEKDYEKIVTVGDRLPETVIQEDDKLLMYFDNAQVRLGM